VVDLIERRARFARRRRRASASPQVIPLGELAADLQRRRARRGGRCSSVWPSSTTPCSKPFLEGREIARRCSGRPRARARRGPLHAVLCCAAYRNRGIVFLLDAICRLLPSPLDAPADCRHGRRDPTGPSSGSPPEEAAGRWPSRRLHDPQHLGQQIFARVYSGVLSKGQTVHNATTGRKERIGRILQIEAKKRTRSTARRRARSSRWSGSRHDTGDTLCTTDAPLLLERIHVPGR